MNLLNWIKVIDKKVTALSVESNLCTSRISPKSSCQSCVEVCPTKSISFNNKEIVIDDHCVECGLCTAVCPTGSIVMNRPSLSQITYDLISTCERNETVYLHCDKVTLSKKRATAVSVPCLGMIPREAWVRIMNKCENLSIYHPDACQGCEITTGEQIWRKELEVGEKMCGQTIPILTQVYNGDQEVSYDLDRRAFLSSLFNEMKSTNKLVLKEMAGGAPSIPSYLEKIKDSDSVTKVKKEWEALSHQMVENITKESAYPYMQKRSLFISELQGSEELQNRKDTRLPEILPDCSFCGACTILCPTEAIQMEYVNDRQVITLTPYKCVGCSLCEEICYTESIVLLPQPNGMLLREEHIIAAKNG
ncbi:4Fe-4S binding protein [Niallia sp. Krafla_26]|uniref:4Fe-4S binding protein n=1 Tax=Niallia sp. Krafla_26 TaxID=3064703 RepID=UPI003D167E63